MNKFVLTSQLGYNFYNLMFSSVILRIDSVQCLANLLQVIEWVLISAAFEQSIHGGSDPVQLILKLETRRDVENGRHKGCSEIRLSFLSTCKA